MTYMSITIIMIPFPCLSSGSVTANYRCDNARIHDVSTNHEYGRRRIGDVRMRANDKLTHDTKSDRKIEKFTCHCCKRVFSSLKRLNNHRRFCAQRDDMLRCAKCQEMFLRPDYYKHVEYCNRQSDVKTEGSTKTNDVFLCLICGFRGIEFSHREMHYAGVGGKAFGCSACSYKSDQRVHMA